MRSVIAIRFLLAIAMPPAASWAVDHPQPPAARSDVHSTPGNPVGAIGEFELSCWP